MEENQSQIHLQNDRTYEVDIELIERILLGLEMHDKSMISSLLENYHAADIADLLEQIKPTQRMALLDLWGKDIDSEVFAELDENISATLLEELPDSVVSEVMRDLDSDDVVDLIEDMDSNSQEKILDALEDNDKQAVRTALTYPEYSAGRLMARELVMAPTYWSVGQAIDDLRRDENLPNQFYDLMVVDVYLKPVGKVPLHSLISAPRDQELLKIMDQEFLTIPVLQSQEDVAYAFNQYNLASAPVVDEQGRLVGVITMDDAMEILEEEADEDIKRLGGVGDESLTDGIAAISKRRFPWLGINLITCVLASIVIAQFSNAIDSIVALAILMPIVASMGGNAGTQTLTVAVRALATKDLTPANAWRVILREGLIGFINGIIFAVIIGGIGMLWYGSALLGIVLGCAMIINMLVAGFVGILVPVLLDRFHFDPALGSSALVTTVTDVIGFLAFLGLATIILL